MAEQQKWDRYYASLPVVEEDEPTRQFNAQLAAAVGAFLEPGSRVLEAGCGGGWQSLALAQTRRYAVSLMDFSEQALGYARRVFERAQVPATFLAGDVLAPGDGLPPGEPAYDLVFNAGVLEHYTLEQQVDFLRGMANRSRQYVLALVPNRQCYWYWLWRTRLVSGGQWPFGKEVPADDLAAAFGAAGLTVVGRAFFGEAWTESFITSLTELTPDLRDEILAIHRSPLIPLAQRCYLVAWLGVVPGAAPASPAHWTVPDRAEEPSLPEALAALADALALRISQDRQLAQLQSRFEHLERSAKETGAQLAAREQAAAELSQTLAEQTRRISVLQSEWEHDQLDLRQLRARYESLEQSARDVSTQLAVSQQSGAELRRKLAEQTRQASEAKRGQAQDKLHVREVQAQLKSQAQIIAARDTALAEGERGAAALRAELAAAQSTVAQMAGSKFWRLGMAYWRARYLARHHAARFWPSLAQTPAPPVASAAALPVPAAAPVAAPAATGSQPGVARLLTDTWPCSEGDRAVYRQKLLAIVRQHSAAAGIVVMAPTIDWEVQTFQRPHQLAQTFARRGYLVFFCLTQGSPDAPNGFQQLEDGLFLSRVPADILSGLPGPIVVVLPYNAPFLRHFSNPIVVYDYLDELEVFPYDQHALQLMHIEMLYAADVVVATAGQLFDQVKGIRPDAVLAPNGVDYDHFAPARQLDTEPPRDLQDLLALGRPIIGYYGLLAEWVDFELLRATAQARPDLEFVLIGQVRDSRLALEPALQCRNVHWLDARPYRGLPAYLRYFSVAIIPFKVNRITLATSPLKLFEYMAGHKPVVSTPLPECLKYPAVLIASNPTEFSAALDRALELRADPHYLAQLDALAQANSWNARVTQIVEAIGRVKADSLDSDAGDHRPEAAVSRPGRQLLLEAVREQWTWQAPASGSQSDPALRARVDELERTLAKIYRLKSWRLLAVYWGAAIALRRTLKRPYQALRAKLRRRRLSAIGQPAAPAAAAKPFGAPRGYDVVLFPIIDWEFRFQRPQQLLSQFAQNGHRGFYLRTTFHDNGAAPLTVPLAERVFGVQLPGPTQLNLYQNLLSPEAVGAALAALDELRRAAGIADAVCLVQLPFWTALAEAARDQWGWKIVYDCLDDYGGFGTMSPKLLQEEARLVAFSDLAVATSRSLYDRVSANNHRGLLLPNAADYDHFHPRPPVLPLPDLAGPVVGYYGAIAEWFDVDLVRAAALARPDWWFVLIGHTFGADVKPLRALSNVRLLGEVPYLDLPGYLHRFDVAWIPFKLTPLTQATNPVKFYEYLSAGKPVVAVELPELRPYQGIYYPAGNADDFVRQTVNALVEPPGERVEARLAVARQNTWAHRYQTLQAELAALYGKAVVIVVSFNNLELLRLCLQALFGKTEYPNFEVIVVDNGSAAEVASYLEEYAQSEPRLRVVFNGANLGFARANNIGIRAAGACDSIVLLNNDTIVTPQWLSKLIGYLDNPQVGMVGPVSNGTSNEAKVDLGAYALADLDVAAERYTRDHEQMGFDIPMLAMYCVALRRSLFDEIGLLDEGFEIGMFEDDDFTLRLRRAGYRILCAEDVYIHHWQRASFKLLGEAKYDELFAKNRQRFETKWGRPWQPHQIQGRAESGIVSARVARDLIRWHCNICGSACETRLGDLGHETPTCPTCQSTVRMRAIVHLLSTELFGESLPLADFPVRPDIHGLGLSDWETYARPLAGKLGYTNPYYHQEPRLDILAIDPALEGSQDFLISTDVFEHVAPPISAAFENARRLLKPTGFMVFSVPYLLGPDTIEHFPDLYQFTLEEQNGDTVLRNVRRDGQEETYRNLVFHGGVGATLEMRSFSKAGIQRELAQAGFHQVRFHPEPYFAHGVYWRKQDSVPLVARPASAESLRAQIGQATNPE